LEIHLFKLKTMLKRPKPGESEEDLLEFQRQFLSQGATPAVNVVKHQPRDVVQLDGKSS